MKNCDRNASRASCYRVREWSSSKLIIRNCVTEIRLERSSSCCAASCLLLCVSNYSDSVRTILCTEPKMTTSLSLLASHDEVVRCADVLINGACEEGSYSTCFSSYHVDFINSTS